MHEVPDDVKELKLLPETVNELVEVRLAIERVKTRITAQPQKADDLRDCVDQLEAHATELKTRDIA